MHHENPLPRRGGIAFAGVVADRREGFISLELDFLPIRLRRAPTQHCRDARRVFYFLQHRPRHRIEVFSALAEQRQRLRRRQRQQHARRRESFVRAFHRGLPAAAVRRTQRRHPRPEPHRAIGQRGGEVFAQRAHPVAARVTRMMVFVGVGAAQPLVLGPLVESHGPLETHPARLPVLHLRLEHLRARREKLRPVVHRRPVPTPGRRAPADAAPLVEHEDALPAGLQFARGPQPGQARANDEDIVLHGRMGYALILCADAPGRE